MRMDYKDAKMLAGFLTERGKIIPSRITGNCARHQRSLTGAVKQARSVALLPYQVVYP
jgi:small subunit ribosomal protein S18